MLLWPPLRQATVRAMSPEVRGARRVRVKVPELVSGLVTAPATPSPPIPAAASVSTADMQ